MLPRQTKLSGRFFLEVYMKNENYPPEDNPQPYPRPEHRKRLNLGNDYGDLFVAIMFILAVIGVILNLFTGLSQSLS